jgi:uncharacterized protein YcsI (UPF0317 family)
LKYFKRKGCYLDDLSPIPVNKMPKNQRNKILKISIKGLSKRIRRCNPDIIVILLKKIDKNVRKAIDSSKVTCPVFTVHFPGNGHQKKFMRKFSQLLRLYYLEKTLGVHSGR